MKISLPPYVSVQIVFFGLRSLYVFQSLEFMFLRIPEQHKPGIKKIISVDDNAIQVIVSFLSNQSASFIIPKSMKFGETEESDAVNIIETISTLYKLKEEENLSDRDLVISIVDYIHEKSDEFPSFSEADELCFIQRLTSLLKFNPSGKIMSIRTHRDSVADLEARFQFLSSQWKKETCHMSLISNIVSHPAYQQIIKMGSKVVPLILQELSKEPDHWFPALRAITGENPVMSEDKGRIKKMAEAWLDWGRQHGYEC
ncbi:hypothetical protein V2H45_12735 [Tumidithrix elongata RA019]|uniref:Uncharacterized protein n=1 Tax=Tumidithrix elongata BACA0141 TaxID=2716417 RepID=A0AAW9Q374_9CYAN|nr:hypothetical protein [Tumidithrix elongata RA019]